MPFPLIRISRVLVILFLVQRGGDTLTRGSFPRKYKCLLQKVTFVWFSEFLSCLLVFFLFVCFLRPSQYNSNKYIFGWHVPGGSAGWEDPLEKGMVTHSSILAWKIPWTEESGGLQSMGVAKSRT